MRYLGLVAKFFRWCDFFQFALAPSKGRGILSLNDRLHPFFVIITVSFLFSVWKLLAKRLFFWDLATWETDIGKPGLKQNFWNCFKNTFFLAPNFPPPRFAGVKESFLLFVCGLASVFLCWFFVLVGCFMLLQEFHSVKSCINYSVLL